MDLFTGLLSSLGLSGAAGLNAYIPLLVVGLLTRAGVMHLAQPFDLLANPWVLLAVAVVGALDFVGDKIPGVDHALHLVGGVVNTAAGAVLFASQAGVADVPPALKLAHGRQGFRVRPHGHPLVGAAGSGGVGMALEASELTALGRDGVGFEHPHRVAGPHDGAEVVGLVDLVHQDRQGGLASAQHAADLGVAFGGGGHDRPG